MKEKILNYLKEIEEERKINILLACETGSRAWGFPSPDSDFDVRMIYVHEKDWYLSLSEGRDSIERMFEDNELDITGWDLRKSLRLLKKSNSPLIERIQSPILYRNNEKFREGIRQLATASYSRIACMHHYLSMSAKIFEEIQAQDSYNLKKFFYALRTACVCEWIRTREDLPPIEFQNVLNGIEITSSLKEQIDRLIEFKLQANESYFHSGEKELFSYIEACLMQAKAIASDLPAAKAPIDKLNTFFRAWI